MASERLKKVICRTSVRQNIIITSGNLVVYQLIESKYDGRYISYPKMYIQ